MDSAIPSGRVVDVIAPRAAHSQIGLRHNKPGRTTSGSAKNNNVRAKRLKTIVIN